MRVWHGVAAASLLTLATAAAVVGLGSVAGARIIANLVEVHPAPIAQDEMRRAQAIAVLGGNRDRVNEAASLHLATRLPILVVGKGGGDAPFAAESEKMAWILRTQYHIEPRWVETRSYDTHENATFAWCLVAPQGIRRLVLVTSASHMRRARSEFEAVGFDVIPAPMPDAHEPSLQVSLREFVPSRQGITAARRPLEEWLGALAAPLIRWQEGAPDCRGSGAPPPQPSPGGGGGKKNSAKISGVAQ